MHFRFFNFNLNKINYLNRKLNYFKFKIKDLWHVNFQTIVWFDQNFSISPRNRNTNLEIIIHIKEVKNIYFI